MSIPKLRFAYSPCPNDTFIFDALVNNRLPDLTFDVESELLDIEQLNQSCIDGSPDVCKISVRNYVNVADDYVILKTGAALGRNCGPILVSKKIIETKDLASKTIAIPGLLTTANLLMDIFYPEARMKTEVLFSEIENKVVDGKFDVGLIIHESRFTYKDKGLSKIVDLGELWEHETGLPLPLGCIVARRTLGEKLIAEIEDAIGNSVRHAMKFPDDSIAYINMHAQEMGKDIVEKHIALYVNEFSVNLGASGMRAIEELVNRGEEQALISPFNRELFK